MLSRRQFLWGPCLPLNHIIICLSATFPNLISHNIQRLTLLRKEHKANQELTDN